MNEPALEFVWVGDDAIDPLEQAQTLQILVGAGIKTREEARADLGLGGGGWESSAGSPVAKRGAACAALEKFNPHHNERGLFTTADNAVATVGSVTRKPQPTGVQVASNDAVRLDAGPSAVAQVIEPEPPPPPPESATPRPEETAPPAPRGTVADAVLRNGGVPATPEPVTRARTMSASDDPTATAKEYAVGLYKGQSPKSEKQLSDGGFVVQLPDGSFITFRLAGQASDKREPTTATVEINDPKIKQLNGGYVLKLKFPRK